MAAPARTLETLDTLMTHVIEEIENMSKVIEMQQGPVNNLTAMQATLAELEANIKIIKAGSPQMSSPHQGLLRDRQASAG